MGKMGAPVKDGIMFQLLHKAKKSHSDLYKKGASPLEMVVS